MYLFFFFFFFAVKSFVAIIIIYWIIIFPVPELLQPPPFFLVPKSKFNLYSNYHRHLKGGQRKYDIDHKGRWTYIWTIQWYGNLVCTIKHQYIHYLVSGIIKSHGFCLLLSCVLQYGWHDHFTIDSVDYLPIWILKYLKR